MVSGTHVGVVPGQRTPDDGRDQLGGSAAQATSTVERSPESVSPSRGRAPCKTTTGSSSVVPVDARCAGMSDTAVCVSAVIVKQAQSACCSPQLPTSESSSVPSAFDSDFDEAVSDKGSEMDEFDDFLEDIAKELREGKYSDLKDVDANTGPPAIYSTGHYERAEIKLDRRSPTQLSSLETSGVLKERCPLLRRSPEAHSRSDDSVLNEVTDIGGEPVTAAADIPAHANKQEGLPDCSNNYTSHRRVLTTPTPASCSEALAERESVCEEAKAQEVSKLKEKQQYSSDSCSKQAGNRSSRSRVHLDTVSQAASSCAPQEISTPRQQSESTAESISTTNITTTKAWSCSLLPALSSTTRALIGAEKTRPPIPIPPASQSTKVIGLEECSQRLSQRKSSEATTGNSTAIVDRGLVDISTQTYSPPGFEEPCNKTNYFKSASSMSKRMSEEDVEAAAKHIDNFCEKTFWLLENFSQDISRKHSTQNSRSILENARHVRNKLNKRHGQSTPEKLALCTNSVRSMLYALRNLYRRPTEEAVRSARVRQRPSESSKENTHRTVELARSRCSPSRPSLNARDRFAHVHERPGSSQLQSSRRWETNTSHRALDVETTSSSKDRPTAYTSAQEDSPLRRSPDYPEKPKDRNAALRRRWNGSAGRETLFNESRHTSSSLWTAYRQSKSMKQTLEDGFGVSFLDVLGDDEAINDVFHTAMQRLSVNYFAVTKNKERLSAAAQGRISDTSHWQDVASKRLKSELFTGFGFYLGHLAKLQGEFLPLNPFCVSRLPEGSGLVITRDCDVSLDLAPETKCQETRCVAMTNSLDAFIHQWHTVTKADLYSDADSREQRIQRKDVSVHSQDEVVPRPSLTSGSTRHASQTVGPPIGAESQAFGGVARTFSGGRGDVGTWEEQCNMFLEKLFPTGTAATARKRWPSRSEQRTLSPVKLTSATKKVGSPPVAKPADSPQPPHVDAFLHDTWECKASPSHSRCRISETISNLKPASVSSLLVTESAPGLQKLSGNGNARVSEQTGGLSSVPEPPVQYAGPCLEATAAGEERDEFGLRCGSASHSRPRSADIRGDASARCGASVGGQHEGAGGLVQTTSRNNLDLPLDTQLLEKWCPGGHTDRSSYERLEQADLTTQRKIRTNGLLCERHDAVEDEPWKVYQFLSTRVDGSSMVDCPICKKEYAKTTILAHAEAVHGVRKPHRSHFSSPRRTSTADERSCHDVRSVARSCHRSPSDHDSCDWRPTKPPKPRRRSSSNERPHRQRRNRSISPERSRRTSIPSYDERHRSGADDESLARGKLSKNSVSPFTRLHYHSVSVESGRRFSDIGRSRHRSASEERSCGYPRTSRCHDRSSSDERRLRRDRSSPSRCRSRRDRSSSLQRRSPRDRSSSLEQRRRQEWPDVSVRSRRLSPPDRRRRRISGAHRVEPRYQRLSDRSGCRTSAGASPHRHSPAGISRAPAVEAGCCERESEPEMTSEVSSHRCLPDKISRNQTVDEGLFHRSRGNVDFRPRGTYEKTPLKSETRDLSTNCESSHCFLGVRSREKRKREQTEGGEKEREQLSCASAKKRCPSRLERPEYFPFSKNDSILPFVDRSTGASNFQQLSCSLLRPSTTQSSSSSAEAEVRSETVTPKTGHSTTRHTSEYAPNDSLDQSVPTRETATSSSFSGCSSTPVRINSEELKAIISVFKSSKDPLSTDQPSFVKSPAKVSCNIPVNEEKERSICVAIEESCISPDSHEETGDSGSHLEQLADFCIHVNNQMTLNQDGSGSECLEGDQATANDKEGKNRNQSQSVPSKISLLDDSDGHFGTRSSGAHAANGRKLQNKEDKGSCEPTKKKRRTTGWEPKVHTLPEESTTLRKLVKPEQDVHLSRLEPGEVQKVSEREQTSSMLDNEHAEKRLLKTTELHQNAQDCVSDSQTPCSEISRRGLEKGCEQTSKCRSIGQELLDLGNDMSESNQVLAEDRLSSKERVSVKNIDLPMKFEAPGQMRKFEPKGGENQGVMNCSNSSEVMPKHEFREEHEDDPTKVFMNGQPQHEELSQKEKAKDDSTSKGNQVHLEPKDEQRSKDKPSPGVVPPTENGNGESGPHESDYRISRFRPVTRPEDGESEPSRSAAAPLKPGTIRHHCTRCRMELNSWLSLRTHEMVCARGPPPCPRCYQRLRNPRLHRLTCSGRLPWLCASCHKWNVDSRPRHAKVCSARHERRAEPGDQACGGERRSPALDTGGASSIAQDSVGRSIGVSETGRHATAAFPPPLLPTPLFGGRLHWDQPHGDWHEDPSQVWSQPRELWEHARPL